MTGPRVTSKEYPNLVNQYRLDAGLTVARLAALANIGRQAVLRYQLGRTSPIHSVRGVWQWRPTAIKICKVLGVGPEAVFPAAAAVKAPLTRARVQAIRDSVTRAQSGQLPKVRREYESALGDLRVAAGLTIGDLARLAGVSGGLVVGLQSGMDSPVWQQGKERFGQWKPKALAICAVLGAEPEDVFPGYACRLATPSSDLVPSQIHAITHTSPGDPPDARSDVARELVPLLAAMAPREREALVLTEVLGLTLADAGVVLGGVSVERVRQMAAKARRTCRDVVAKRVLREAIPAQAATLYKRRMAG